MQALSKKWMRWMNQRCWQQQQEPSEPNMEEDSQPARYQVQIVAVL